MREKRKRNGDEELQTMVAIQYSVDHVNVGSVSLIIRVLDSAKYTVTGVYVLV